MRQLPSGTVTFLFSDIEGSTRLRARLHPMWERTCTFAARITAAGFGAGACRLESEAREALGDELFGKAVRAGEAIALDEAIDVALSLEP